MEKTLNFTFSRCRIHVKVVILLVTRGFKKGAIDDKSNSTVCETTTYV